MKHYFQYFLKHAFVLNIYTYSSLMSQGGIGKSIVEDFEETTHIKTNVTTFGDSFQMVNQLELDAKLKRNLPHVLLGFDQNTWPRVKPYADTWKNLTPRDLSKIESFASIENGFLPFDYGELGFIANLQLLKKKSLELPKSLSDLLEKKWKKNFILEDPRLSTPGLFFLIWSEDKLDEPQNFWAALKTQWLLLSSGWSEAYSLFLKDGAPLVWSYKTSLAYHRSESKGDSYDFVKLSEGAPIQIEGAAIIENENAEAKTNAAKFLDILISESIQKKIPKTQWMLPVRKGIPLPIEFQDLVPNNPHKIKPITNTRLEGTLKLWKKSISR